MRPIHRTFMLSFHHLPQHASQVIFLKTIIFTSHAVLILKFALCTTWLQLFGKKKLVKTICLWCVKKRVVLIHNAKIFVHHNLWSNKRTYCLKVLNKCFNLTTMKTFSRWLPLVFFLFCCVYLISYQKWVSNYRVCIFFVLFFLGFIVHWAQKLLW